jgi:hypothetical protein
MPPSADAQIEIMLADGTMVRAGQNVSLATLRRVLVFRPFNCGRLSTLSYLISAKPPRKFGRLQLFNQIAQFKHRVEPIGNGAVRETGG